MKKYNFLQEWGEKFKWNDTYQTHVDPNIQWYDDHDHPLSDEEIDETTMGFTAGSENYLAVTRKILRKYPTKKSMIVALNKLANSVKGLENKENVNSIIDSLQKTQDSDYYKWVNRNLSGDNHPWIRRILSILLTAGVVGGIIAGLGKDSVINTGIPVGSNSDLGISLPGVAAIGAWTASDLRHKYRANNLYNKTPEEILRWNANIED